MSAVLAALKVWLPPTHDAVIVLVYSDIGSLVLTRVSRLLTPLCSVPKLMYRGLGETKRVRIIRLPDARSFLCRRRFKVKGTLPVDSASSIAYAPLPIVTSFLLLRCPPNAAAYQLD